MTEDDKYITRAKFYLARSYNVSRNKTKEQTLHIAKTHMEYDLRVVEKKLNEVSVTA